MSKVYVEKLCEVSVTKFELSAEDIKKLSLTSKFESYPVFRDGAGVHILVAGQRCNLGDYIVHRPEGTIVLSQKELDALYTPKPEPRAVKPSTN